MSIPVFYSYFVFFLMTYTSLVVIGVRKKLFERGIILMQELPCAYTHKLENAFIPDLKGVNPLLEVVR